MHFDLSIQTILLLIVIFCFSTVEISAYTSNNTSTKSSEYKIGDVRLLNPPNRDAPTEVYVSFHLQDVDEIDDQLETFHLV